MRDSLDHFAQLSAEMYVYITGAAEAFGKAKKLLQPQVKKKQFSTPRWTFGLWKIIMEGL